MLVNKRELSVLGKLGKLLVICRALAQGIECRTFKFSAIISTYFLVYQYKFPSRGCSYQRDLISILIKLVYEKPTLEMAGKKPPRTGTMEEKIELFFGALHMEIKIVGALQKEI